LKNKISLLIFSCIILFSSCLKESEDPYVTAKDNLKTGEKFLVTNAKEKGVITTESGLQYRTLKSTEGLSPKINNEVECNYEGRFINGDIFDSSYKRGESAKFAVDRVIKGWTEALMLMHEGEKWQLYIPHYLAYGTRGYSSIGPCQTLIFDIELVKITQ
jgi:FKBP-type peptidyl-prolyl cis-trans isomerase